MWSGPHSIVSKIPLAVWALLLMALFSFAVFNYQQSLQMASFRSIQPLEDCVREAGYRLSKGYLHLARLAAGEPGVSRRAAFRYLRQARTSVRAGLSRLRADEGRFTARVRAADVVLRSRFEELEIALQAFLDAAEDRFEGNGTDGTPLSRPQLGVAYRQAEEVIDEIRTELSFRARLLERKQRQVNILLSGGWVAFAIGMCFVIVRVESRGRQWELALARSEARLRSMFAVFPDPVLIIDADGRIVDVPSPSHGLLPGEPEQLRGAGLEQVVGADRADEAITLIRKAASGDQVLTFEYEQVVRGRKRFFEGRIVSIPDSGQSHVLWLAHDLTSFRETQERRLDLERRVRQAQKLESLGVMAGGIAHDFDNLLTSIIGHAEVAMTEMNDRQPLAECLREVHKAASKAAELAAQMLRYSGNTHLAFGRTDICGLVADVVSGLETEIPDWVDVSVESNRKSAEFDGDYQQIHQIIRNLVLNASEAIGRVPGAIRIYTGMRTCTQNELEDNYFKESYPPGDYAFVRVEDTGCGINEKDYERLFDPFFTTKFTGRGLGLAAVQGIVRSHDGIIRVNSVPGSVTRFEILFPVAKRDRPAETNAVDLKQVP